EIDAALAAWKQDPKSVEGKWVHAAHLEYAAGPDGAPKGSYGRVGGAEGPIVSVGWSVALSELHTSAAAAAEVEEPNFFEAVGKLGAGPAETPLFTMNAVRTRVVAAIPGVGASTDKVEGVKKVASPYATDGEFKRGGN